MEKYKIKINPAAVRDLNRIYEYIAKEKFAPENARGQVDRIKKAIMSLDTFPQSHQERLEGRYAERGYRQLIVDNFLAVFRIDEDEKIITVVTIQFQGRNV